MNHTKRSALHGSIATALGVALLVLNTSKSSEVCTIVFMLLNAACCGWFARGPGKGER